MGVTLRKRKNSDGSTTLRLDIYHQGQRWVETLNNLKLCKPITPLDREENKNKVRLAEAIAIKKANDIINGDFEMNDNKSKSTYVLDWIDSYLQKYTKKDKRNMEGVVGRFKSFLIDRDIKRLVFSNLTPLILEDFIDYLEERSVGEGAVSYYKRFKKMLSYAYRSKVISSNIVDFVSKKPRGKARKKDFLTLDEIKILSQTPIQSDPIRRAFLFTCVTGLRHSDVRKLTWNKIDLSSKTMSVLQEKTKHYSEEITLPLNSTAIKLLGERGTGLVFDLPVHNACNKTLKAWIKRSGIEKHITWHNGRHSFGTNLIHNDVDVYTASKLLGHSSLKHTERYVRASAEMKQRGADKINIDL